MNVENILLQKSSLNTNILNTAIMANMPIGRDKNFLYSLYNLIINNYNIFFNNI